MTWHAGVRRVEAVGGAAAVDYLNSLDSAVKAVGQQLKVKLKDLPARVTGTRPPCPALPCPARDTGCLQNVMQ